MPKFLFQNINLSNARLELLSDENSMKYTTISTSEALFMHTHLVFGLRPSFGIFRSYTCKILNNIEGVIVYQDEIIVTSPNKEQLLWCFEKRWHSFRDLYY